MYHTGFNVECLLQGPLPIPLCQRTGLVQYLTTEVLQRISQDQEVLKVYYYFWQLTYGVLTKYSMLYLPHPLQGYYQGQVILM